MWLKKIFAKTLYALCELCGEKNHPRRFGEILISRLTSNPLPKQKPNDTQF